MATPFSEIYDRFFNKITDDMYLVWTKEDTEKDIENILLDAIPGFEFPHFGLYDYSRTIPEEDDEIIELDNLSYEQGEVDDIIDLDNPRTKAPIMQYNCTLNSEEINILAGLMYNVWLQRQIASIENTRMKYSGTDFKFSSQANHLDKLMKLKQEAERQDRHIQRLYNRRKIVSADGHIKSNWSTVMERSTFDEY